MVSLSLRRHYFVSMNGDAVMYQLVLDHIPPLSTAEVLAMHVFLLVLFFAVLAEILIVRANSFRNGHLTLIGARILAVDAVFQGISEALYYLFQYDTLAPYARITNIVAFSVVCIINIFCSKNISIFFFLTIATFLFSYGLAILFASIFSLALSFLCIIAILAFFVLNKLADMLSGD